MNEPNYRTKDCRTCQNMSCRVEQHEKPIKNCIAYIYHDSNEEKIKTLKKLGVDTRKKKY
jgi:aerobic-type carbon monoxide dehydrogenase small subunit (CoxS/CutS family)